MPGGSAWIFGGVWGSVLASWAKFLWLDQPCLDGGEWWQCIDGFRGTTVGGGWGLD